MTEGSFKGPFSVRIMHSNGQVLSDSPAWIREGLTALELLDSEGVKTVVPLANVLHYEVREAE